MGSSTDRPLRSETRNFVSWKLDPTARCTDAFLTEWKKGSYVQPSLCPICPGLAKLKEDKTTLSLIVTAWQEQRWYPTLFLPNRQTDPTTTKEFAVNHTSKAFRNKQPICSSKAGDVRREHLATA